MVKVFVKDPEYLRYFNLVKQLQGNPHVPKVRGNFMKVGTEGYVVRLEPLTPLANPHDPVFKRYISPKLQPYMDNLLEEENLDFLQRYHPKLYALFMAIFSMTTEIDWHEGNLMKRGDTLVVTDPLAT